MVVANSLLAILQGSPVDANHRVVNAELRKKLEEMEVQSALNGALYFEDTLANLNSTSPANLDTGFVLRDGTASNNGVYQYQTATWVKTSDLPTGFTDALSVASDLATETAARAAADAALTTAMVDLVGGTAIRPGEKAASFSTLTTGAPAGLPSITATAGVTTDTVVGLGMAAIVDDVAVTIASREAFAVQPGRIYRAHAYVQRLSDGLDPAGSTVRLVLQRMDAAFAGLGVTVLEGKVLRIADGRWHFDSTFAVNPGALATVDQALAATTIYVRPYVHTYTADHRTAVAQIEVVDITEAARITGALNVVALATAVDDAEAAAAVAVASTADQLTTLLLNFPSVELLLEDTARSYSGDGAIEVGAIIETRKELFVYKVAAQSATDHHVTTAGGVKLYVLPVHGNIHIGAWGSPTTSETFNKAFADLVSVYKPTVTDYQKSPDITVCHSGPVEVTTRLNAYDVAEIGGDPEVMGFHVDFKSMNLVRAPASTLGVTDAMMKINVRNACIHVPGRDMANLSSGIIFGRCKDANIYIGNIGQRQGAGYDIAFTEELPASQMVEGVQYVIKEVGDTDFEAVGAADDARWTVFRATGPATGTTGQVFAKGEMDNCRVHGFRSYERIRTDPQSARQGVGFFINAYDLHINDASPGWHRRPILIGPGAGKVFIIAPHVFNGAGIDGDVPVIQNPIGIENYSRNEVQIINPYGDNGIFRCNTGTMQVFGGSYLELETSANIDGARMQVVCDEENHGTKPKTLVGTCPGLSVSFLAGGDQGQFQWAGNYDAINGMKDEAEIEQTLMTIARRFVSQSTGTDDTPFMQFRKASGRFALDFQSADSETYRILFDPLNGEIRWEFPRTVTTGVHSYGAANSVDVTGGVIDASMGTHLSLTCTGSTAIVTSITGGINGDTLKLVAASGKTIILKHDPTLGNDEAYLRGSDVILTPNTRGLALICDGANWRLEGGAITGVGQTEFSTYSGLKAYVDLGVRWAIGTKITAGDTVWQSDPSSTEMPWLPGLLHFGVLGPGHAGLTGTGDETAGIQALVDYACAVDAQIVGDDKTFYSHNGTVAFTGNIRLKDWRVKSTKTVRDGADFDDDRFFLFDNTPFLETSATADFLPGFSALEVADASNVQAGDYAHMQSTRLINTDHRGGWKEGEVLPVYRVDGNVVTLDGSFAYYARANNATTGTITAITDGYNITLSDMPAGSERDHRILLRITSGDAAGEERYIIATDGSTVTHESGTYDRGAWPAGLEVGDAYSFEWKTTVSFYRPKKARLENVHLKRDLVLDATAGDRSFRGMQSIAWDIEMVGGSITGFAETGWQCKFSVQPLMQDVVVDDISRAFSVSNGTGYGGSFITCHKPVMRRVTGRRCRRVGDFSGSTGYTVDGVFENIVGIGGGKTYTGDAFWPAVGGVRQSVCGGHGSALNTRYRNSKGVNTYGGEISRGTNSKSLGLDMFGICHYGAAINKGASGTLVDGMRYRDGFSESLKAAADRHVVPADPGRRMVHGVVIEYGHEATSALPIVVQNCDMGALVSSLVLCEVPSGSNVTGLTVQNNTVTCSPEGTSETDFRILRTTQDVTLDGSRVEGNKARALEPYSGAVVDIPFIGTSGVDPKNFTMDAGQSNHINGVLWFQIDVASVVAVRSGAIGNQFSLDIRNARSGATRPQAWGIIAEPDQATDRNPNSTKVSIELLATAPTVSTDATAGSIGVHFSRSTGLATFANNQGNAQTLGLRMSG